MVQDMAVVAAIRTLLSLVINFGVIVGGFFVLNVLNVFSIDINAFLVQFGLPLLVVLGSWAAVTTALDMYGVTA